MVKSGIKIFARIRPTKKQAGVRRHKLLCFTKLSDMRACVQPYEVGEADDGVATVSFHVPRSEASGYVNNKKFESYSFINIFLPPPPA